MYPSPLSIMPADMFILHSYFASTYSLVISSSLSIDIIEFEPISILNFPRRPFGSQSTIAVSLLSPMVSLWFSYLAVIPTEASFDIKSSIVSVFKSRTTFFCAVLSVVRQDMVTIKSSVGIVSWNNV